ncbi:MAG: 2-phosphosulfolactate phosphatase [Verrucomicrobiota bacterium]|nr:2-phosphosulfolactate phosphatase [Verrucomicrobiota bacterium]MCC6819829.1 2-phosphosulfolactate phosphatase [Limisphaerales bacterium]
MTATIEACLSPADYQAQAAGGFRDAVCVVFDILRATSVMVAGLANGAAGFVPAAEIAEALAFHPRHRNALLAGERNGVRITAMASGGVDFDLGNSPREYTRDRVRGRMIITTTTNGTRALRACATAKRVAVASFLNLSATADWLAQHQTERIILVCAGTAEHPALEDILAAGALCELLVSRSARAELRDSAETAVRVYREARTDLFGVISRSQNGRRLMANAELRDDVAFCLQRDVSDLVALLGMDGVVRTSA